VEYLEQPQIAAGLGRALDGYYERLQLAASAEIVDELIRELGNGSEIEVAPPNAALRDARRGLRAGVMRCLGARSGDPAGR
jgi:hypothetical protein